MSLRTLILSVCAAYALPASAALTVALNPAVQNAARGAEIVFSGTLTNTSPTDKLFLNDLHAAFDGSAGDGLALDPNAFFANVPGILLPGETYVGPVFRLMLGTAAPVGDYTGTITLQGGADLDATASLASTGFTVLSPEVNITATDPEASEFGPDSGTFTITRTGSTNIPIAVSLTIGGSAQNGTTYESIASSVTIPINATAGTVTITPIPDRIAQGDRLATLSITPSAVLNLGASATASVTIHDTPADAWRLKKFGANANDPAAADAADWDGDGLANLVEYALDLDPKTPDLTAFPISFQQGDYLYFSYVPNSAALDVEYTVEAATDLGVWSTDDVEPVTVPNPIPPNRVTVRYRHPVSLTDHVFLRLSVGRP